MPFLLCQSRVPLDILCSHRLFFSIEKAIHIVNWEEIKRNILVKLLIHYLIYLTGPFDDFHTHDAERLY